MKRTMATDNDAGKRTLNDLRVIDLRSALEKRSLDKSGVKAVLLERLQKALEEDGVDPENFYSEVMKESTPSRKPKRTNKKLTRDDESETHSNVDDSLQNDLSLELDSDDERMDKGLEATDVVEDAINLSIEEEEKLLTEEDDGIAEREEKEEKAVEGKEKTTTATSVVKSNSANGKPPVLVVTLSEQDSLELAASSTSPTMFNGEKQKTDDGHSGHHGKDASAASTPSSKSNADSMSEKTDVGKDADAGKGDKKCGGDADASLSGQQKTTADVGKRSASSEKPSAGSDGAAADGEGGSHSGEGGGAGGGDGGEKSQKESSSSAVTAKVEKKEEGHKEDTAAPSGTTASGQSARANKSVATASRDAKGRVRVRPKKASTAVNSKNLWVSGLSSSTRATDLKNLFSKYGKVIGAKIVTNARAPVSRYYGFVTMASSEEATKCIEHLHRIELHGRMISVEKAKNEPVSQQKAGAKVTVRKDAKSASVKATTESPQQKETKVKAENEVEPAAADEAVASKDVKETEKHEEVVKKEEVVEKDEKEKTKEQKPDAEVSKETKATAKASSLSSKSRSKSRDGHGKEAQSSSNNFTYANVRRHTTYRGGYRLVRRAMITRRPFTYRPRNLLTFKKITAERIRQRQREEEREMREVERRRHQDFLRQKDIERKQRDEAIRLERERDRLRMEREKLEREKAEVLRHEREKQRMERERIEREREDLRRREFGGRYDDTRRPFKRPMEPRGPREEHWGNRNKRPNLGPNRFNVGGPPGGFHGNDRGGRPEPYERVKVERYDRRPMDEDRFHEPPARRTDMGRREPPMHHDRDERRIVMRAEGVRDVGRFVRGPPPMAGGGSGGRDRDMPRDDRDRDRERMGPPRGDIMHIRRPSPRTDWKQNSQDRSGGSRGHHNPPSAHDIGGGRGDRERYADSGSKGLSGSSGYGGSSRSLGDNRYGGSDRGGDSWHSGGPSSSSDHRSGSKQYSSSTSSGGILGGGPSRESWGGDRKVEGGQSWGRSEGGQADRWGSGGLSGGMETRSIRSTQSASVSQPVLPQTGSSMYGTASSSDTGGMMMGMNSGGGSSYASGDRYDAYKGLSSMRRY